MAVPSAEQVGESVGRRAIPFTKGFAVMNEWMKSIHPDLPPQRIRWQAGIYRPRYGAILWYSSHEMFGLWFNGHHEQVMIPESVYESKDCMLAWIARYLMGLENAPSLSITVMDGDLCPAGLSLVV